MRNNTAREAMHLLCGDIAHDHPEFSAILLRCLSCIVHHKDKITDMVHSVPGHNFHKLRLFCEPNLIAKLEKLNTTNKSPTMVCATGIPPHVKTSQQLGSMLGMLHNMLEIKGIWI